MWHSFISYLVLLLLFMAGCATSNPGQEKISPKMEPNYDTGKNMADLNFNTFSLFDPVQIKYEVATYCIEPDCKSAEVWLSFFLVPGPTKISLNNRSLSIDTGQDKYLWKGTNWDYMEDPERVVGRIISVPLDKKMLFYIAMNKKISGTLSGERFEWNYDNREPIRKLVADMHYPATEL